MRFSEFFSGNDIYRRMGYYKDQNGIVRRYFRETEFWDPHLEKTKNFILKNAENKNKAKVAVLGSGWLLDVPAEELAGMFWEVTLIDIKHPPQIRRRMMPFSNVKFIETDISGLGKVLFQAAGEHKAKIDPEAICPEYDFDLSGYSYVISCNILNQLDIILLDYLKKKCELQEDIENKLRTGIQENHLKILPQNKSCLISDVEEIWLDRNNTIQNRISLIYADMPEPSEIWTWYFDNRYTYQENYKTWFEVHAFEI